ncbi:MAG: TetR/AcrR family transcriptional regulator [Rhodospirillales bacterium]|nr:TetR/AcrR family transcriptional regulator [Rhodospirillales bacterium]
MPRDSSDTRQRIERHALRLFVEHGADGTSVRDIAQAAKVAEGALYRHYESKDALVAHLFAANYTRFAGELDAAQRAEGTGRGKVRAMVATFCRFFDADPVLFRFLLFVQHGQLARLPDDAATPVTVLQDVMTGAIERREIPRRDPALSAAWVMGLVLQTATFAVYGRVKPPLAPLSAEIAEAAWRAISTPMPAR